MGYFKIVILLILLASTLFSFSKKPKSVQSKDFALVVDNSKSCQSEIKNRVKDLLNLKDLKFVNTLFTESSYLDMKNSVDVYKKLILHVDSNSCVISHVIGENRVVSSKILTKCSCKRVLK